MATSAKDIRFIELQDQISKLNDTIIKQSENISSLTNQISKLLEENAYLRKKLFGASSEKHKTTDINGQMSLFDLFDLEKPAEEIEVEVIEVKAHTKTRKTKKSLEDQFKNIPTREVVVDTLSAEEKICSKCGSEMVAIGTEEIRSEITFIPAKLERVIYKAVTYACKNCEQNGTQSQFIKDEGIPALIPHSYASPSLVAHTIYEKFANYMPLYRQEQDWKRFDVSISRTSMAHWIIYCKEHYLQPLYDYFHRELLKHRHLMADETPIQVLKEEGRRAETKSYLWLVRTGEYESKRIVLYNYTPTRAGDNIVDFLDGAPDNSYLMVDGYGGYNKLKKIKRCACWAHIRRYILEAVPKGFEHDLTNPAVQGLMYCDKLFSYERSYREKQLTTKQRYNRRLRDEKPLIEAFLAWAEKQVTKPGTRMARAINYILNRKEILMTFLEDGDCSLSNNWSENSIRPVTVGRKNWLFSDTTAGADANAVVLTIVEMAKAYQLNIYKYIEYLLEHRPSKDMSDEELDRLSPWSEEVLAACASNQE